MEWSDEELSDVMSRGSSAAPTGIRVPALPASTLKAMMTRAVKLVAARGGTMTAKQVAEWSLWLNRRDEDGAHPLVEHIAAQGARIAVLEADVAKARQSEDVWRKRLEAAAVALGAHGAGQVGRLDIVARVRILLDETAWSRQREESIRRRSLEAGNLERLISEHGLPAAMRWVVDGEEPAQSLVKTVTVSAGMAGGPLKVLFRTTTYPCSSTCTHDDAATPGHSERVKERSEAVERATFRDGRDEGYTEGSEAMRAACLKDVREALANVGAWDRETERIVAAAIEGATP